MNGRRAWVRVAAPLLVTLLVASVGGFAVASQGDSGEDVPEGVYDGDDESVLEALGERAAGEKASQQFNRDTIERVNEIPVEERLEHTVVDCASIGVNGEGVKGCVRTDVSDKVRTIDPAITEDDIRRWEGSSLVTPELEASSCEALKQVGYDGPHC